MNLLMKYSWPVAIYLCYIRLKLSELNLAFNCWAWSFILHVARIKIKFLAPLLYFNDNVMAIMLQGAFHYQHKPVFADLCALNGIGIWQTKNLHLVRKSNFSRDYYSIAWFVSNFSRFLFWYRSAVEYMCFVAVSLFSLYILTWT